MNKEELIVKQQIDIEDMKIDIDAMQKAFQIIYDSCYAVGMPLNDNVLDFNKQQRDFLRKIARIAESNLPENE